jgi:hypothetical protein
MLPLYCSFVDNKKETKEMGLNSRKKSDTKKEKGYDESWTKRMM